MAITHNPTQKSTPRSTPRPQATRNGNGGGRLATSSQKSGNSESVKLTDESKQLIKKGTNQSDRLSASGQLPNLVAAFGGDDNINLRGDGKTKVEAGDGDDIVDVGAGEKGSLEAEVDGGKGNDALFIGNDMGPGGNFHVKDKKGRTIAQKGEGGSQIQTRDVETVFASNTTEGTKGDDTVNSDFKNRSDVKLIETHNIATGEGNDTINVATGNKGSSEVNLIPGPGNNRVNFAGGAADDKVYYSSERDYAPDAEGGDRVRFRGGEGNDQLSINSQSYSLLDKEGKVLSKFGEGRDQISVDGFEQVWVNGEELSR